MIWTVSIVLVIFFTAMLLSGLGKNIADEISWISRKTAPKAIEASDEPDLSGLSKTARKIVQKYMKLPEEYRSFDDIISIVKALDLKTSNGYDWKTIVDYHFDRHNPYASEPLPIADRCDHSDCIYSEYNTLLQEIDGLALAHKQKEHALKLAAVQMDVDAVASLTAHLRSEKEIAQHVAKEIV